MPCRSSRASISLRPRDSFVRSRLPSGASGGTAGFAARGAGAAAIGRGDDAGRVAGAAGEGSVRGAACTLATRCFLSGLTCLATLSHSARSSSLSARRRGEGRGPSTAGRDDRFIAADGNDFSPAAAAPELARSRDAAPVAGLDRRQRQSRLYLARPQPELPAWQYPWQDPSQARFAETALRSSPKAAGLAPAT